MSMESFTGATGSAPSPVLRKFTDQDYEDLVKELGHVEETSAMYEIFKSRMYKVDYSDVSMANFKWEEKSSSTPSNPSAGEKVLSPPSYRAREMSPLEERQQIQDLIDKATRGTVSIPLEAIQVAEAFLEYQSKANYYATLNYSGYTGGDSRSGEDSHYAYVDSQREKLTNLSEQVKHALGMCMSLIGSNDIFEYLRQHIQDTHTGTI